MTLLLQVSSGEISGSRGGLSEHKTGNSYVLPTTSVSNTHSQEEAIALIMSALVTSTSEHNLQLLRRASHSRLATCTTPYLHSNVELSFEGWHMPFQPWSGL